MSPWGRQVVDSLPVAVIIIIFVLVIIVVDKLPRLDLHLPAQLYGGLLQQPDPQPVESVIPLIHLRLDHKVLLYFLYHCSQQKRETKTHKAYGCRNDRPVALQALCDLIHAQSLLYLESSGTFSKL